MYRGDQTREPRGEEFYAHIIEGSKVPGSGGLLSPAPDPGPAAAAVTSGPSSAAIVVPHTPAAASASGTGTSEDFEVQATNTGQRMRG